MLTNTPNQCAPRQVQESGRGPVSVSILTPSLDRDHFPKYLQIRCFWSPAPALVVPCTPMHVLSSVNEGLLAHVLHGICPNVMIFEEPTRNGGFLEEGETAREVMRDKVCPPSLGTSVPTVWTPEWSRAMGFHPAKPCLAVLPYPKCATYFCPCPRGNARGAGGTTTLHSLMSAPAFGGRVSTTALSPYQAC